MKRLLLHLLPVLCALVLPSCVTDVEYDPDYSREAVHIQDTSYPADTILGEWMAVGIDFVGDLMYEERLYVSFDANGTGRSITVKQLPAIYSEYKELFKGPKDFSGEQIVESNFAWSYLGKNKWEYTFTSPRRFLARVPWMTSHLTNEVSSAKIIVRHHNGKLFFPQSHNTAVSTNDEAAVKAKLAKIRAINDSSLRSSLAADRVLFHHQKGFQTPAYSQ
ncbi:MAG: hypothetical protein ACO1TE_23575 [Prosthecobacter sp.]